MDYWFYMCMIMILPGLVKSLKCFQCDNLKNPACGVDFKAYQYQAETCKDSRHKCGLQRQKPRDNYIGIFRACYPLGSLAGLEDESDGCYELWTKEFNETYTLCLCSKDYCNTAERLWSSNSLTFSAICLYVIVIYCALQQ